MSSPGRARPVHFFKCFPRSRLGEIWNAGTVACIGRVGPWTQGGGDVVTRKGWSSAGDRLTMLFEVGAIGRLTDADLLARYISGRGDSESEAAFTMIVERHGRMVLGVCRRILGDEH